MIIRIIEIWLNPAKINSEIESNVKTSKKIYSLVFSLYYTPVYRSSRYDSEFTRKVPK